MHASCAAAIPDGAAVVDAAGAGGGMKIGTNFWHLGWGIWDAVMKPDVDFATTTDPWNPAFLAEVEHYRVLRFMDFGQVNRTTETTWSDRTPKTAGRPTQEKLAFEWMIGLSDRTGAAMWGCVPTRAADDYALQLATLTTCTTGSGARAARGAPSGTSASR